MLVYLLTAGVACGLGAFLISLRMGGRGRMQQAGALFLAMLALLLAQLYPDWGGLLGIVSIIAALAYAIPAARSALGQRGHNDDRNDR